MKKIYIIHGWSGYPGEGWFPWLKKELEDRGFEVVVPSMPEADYPKIEKWVQCLNETVGIPNEDSFFVGHSIGCQTIMRFLQNSNKVGGAVFIAPWINLMNLTEEDKIIAKPWLETPIDFDKVRSNVSNLITIFSDNDPVVPIENKELFEKYLGAKIVVENGKGHFSGEDGVMSLPSALDAVLKITA